MMAAFASGGAAREARCRGVLRVPRGYDMVRDVKLRLRHARRSVSRP
jgi:hypothetical protein